MNLMRYLWIAGLFGAFVGAFAAPELQIEPALLDLGRVTDRTKPVPVVYKLKNIGDGELRIESVKPG